MFPQTPLRNVALKSPALLGLASQLQSQAQRSATSGGATAEPEAAPLNLPAQKTLTAAEQRACFGPAATAGGSTPPPDDADAAGRSEVRRRAWNLADRASGITPSAVRSALARADPSSTPSFAGGLPSPQTMLIGPLARACERVLGRPDAHTALQYSATAGLRELREAVAAFLPWPVHPDQVMITAGSQGAIFAVAVATLQRGRKVVVETPTYLGALKAFQAFEPDMVGVACDEEGMLPADLEAKIEGASLLYIQPNFQNPTGHCMSVERREAITRIAARAGVLVLEDDAYGRLWFDGPPPPSLASYNPENTMHAGSFSKFLALPGLRLAYLVVADPQIRAMLEMIKEVMDLQSSTLGQRLLIEVIRDGVMKTHLPHVRAHYKQNRDAMLAALQREMDGLGVTWNRPAGGMFVWATLPRGMSASALLTRALAMDVCFIPGREFYATEPDDRTLRLSYATPNPEQIASGIASLAKAVREMQEDARLAIAENEPQAVS